METLTLEARTALIDRAVDACGARDADARAFVHQFLASVPQADLLAAGERCLAGAALSLWRFGRERPAGTAKVRAFDPDARRDGWVAPHTVVEIVNDDMPFLVDSVMAALEGQGRSVHLVVHPVLAVRRDAAGQVEAIAEAAPVDSFIHVQIDAGLDAAALDDLVRALHRVLADVRAAVTDWPAMLARVEETAAGLATNPPPVPAEETAEARAFLSWLTDGHFTFLGVRDYTLEGSGGSLRAVPIAGSELGILRPERMDAPGAPRGLVGLPAAVLQALTGPDLLETAKSAARATVHRPVMMDYVGVKRFDTAGKVVGKRRFLGLYTTVVYTGSPRAMPLLRRKVAGVVARAGFRPNSHDEKALVHILETYPRDELFQTPEDQLSTIALGILALQERRRIALFIRRDPFERSASCLVFVPRDRYSAALSDRFGAMLAQAFGGEVVTKSSLVGDEPLARIHYVVATTPGAVPAVDEAALERQLVEAGQSWADRLSATLVERYGEAEGLELARRHRDTFDLAYQDRYSPYAAMRDLPFLDEAAREGIALRLYRPREAAANELRLKLFNAGGPVPLSDILPMLESMGVRVLGEAPFQTRPAGAPVWIQDFDLASLSAPGDIAALRAVFESAFRLVWRGEVENDGFNRLVLAAGLDWRRITVFRAFAKYLRQVGNPFAQATMEATLAGHPDVARLLADLFAARFDPDAARGGEAAIEEKLAAALDGVENPDEDRILRRFLNLIHSALRTNYYQSATDGAPKPYLSIKLDSRKVDDLPLPRPQFEVFVYATSMEGIHLRGGTVARGGIRWSDRREDFRTEILGLMKAQQVKNAVIVPVGAKGGFVPKRPEVSGVEAYKTLVRGLLDITDNIVEGKVVPPERVVRHDDDDPYLVVAADKGTATFSDIANGLSAEYGFWLGDAFASGGSAGYDHKGMGITARGAWELIKRHFRELGRDIQAEDFTVVGVGDMAGDVFGNGMLLSRHIRLIGAFNHMHVFVDPDPEPEASWTERKRLFDTPRSTWADYAADKLSKGGGIYPRSAKTLPLSPEARAAFGLGDGPVAPADLIRAMLTAPVDLLWFGGIGTFIKAHDETHAQVNDRANDALRIDGRDIRAKVVGEGANLGATQRGRIEYALAGGRIDTDSIDNSAGVDTSDHEVNIKIMLGTETARGTLTLEARNALLQSMTDEVAALVLRNNYLQGQALSIAEAEAPARLARQARFMRALERDGRLNRAIEYLPDDETIAQRETAQRGLVRPELAILISYAKLALYQDLLPSPLPDDPQLVEDLHRYFPFELREHHREALVAHPLRREIIATVVANSIVNRAGISFVSEMAERTGRSTADIARAYAIARETFGMRGIWGDIEALDGKVPAAAQTRMLCDGNRLLERATLWYLTQGEPALDIARHLEAYAGGIVQFRAAVEARLPPAAAAALVEQGAPEGLAQTVAGFDALGAGTDVVRIAAQAGTPVATVTDAYFAVGDLLSLDLLRQSARLPRIDRAWTRMAVDAFTDDVNALQAAATAGVVAAGGLEQWCAARPSELGRYQRLVEEVKATSVLDLAMMIVLGGQLRTLVGR